MFAGKCYNCNIANCTQCSAYNVCDRCVSGTGVVLVPDALKTSCVPCTINGCLDCANQTYCYACAYAYTLYSGLCYSCNIPYCQSCSADNYCIQCWPSSGGLLQYPSSDHSQCLSCNVSNCVSCSSNNYCSVCQSSYTMNQGKC